MRRSLVGVLAVLVAACGTKWRDFNAPDGSFKVSFPGPPELKEAGDRKTWHAGLGKAVFNVTVQPVPADFLSDASAERVLEELQKASTASCKSPASGRTLSLGTQAYPGREFRCVVQTKVGEVNMTTRAYRAKDRLFILTAMEPADAAPVSDANRFWDSFAAGG